MKTPPFINTLEAQREYVLAMERGYGFAVHGNIAHYKFRVDQLEPSVLREMRAAAGDAPAYIWSFKGCTMASAQAHHQTRISPLSKDLDAWVKHTPVW